MGHVACSAVPVEPCRKREIAKEGGKAVPGTRHWLIDDVDAREVCEFATLRDVIGGGRAHWEPPPLLGG